VRRGRGFSYVDDAGRQVQDAAALERIRDLVIPPAWKDVWICPDPLGHLQATGVDAAGRKQYWYHPRWREQQDRKKFDHMLSFARALPLLRRHILTDLAGDELDCTRVLACAVRLLDVGLFRIGSEQYADEDGGIGLATVTKANVSISDDGVVFDYPAKSGVRRVQAVRDPLAGEAVRADQINDYLKRQIGEGYSAKDFRTWNATVLAAVSLAADGRSARSHSARKRAINGAVRGVSEVLGNTPAVARRSYIDPRVFDRYQSGWTIGGELDRIGTLRGPDDRRRARLERAVLDLLGDERGSPAVQRYTVAEPR